MLGEVVRSCVHVYDFVSSNPDQALFISHFLHQFVSVTDSGPDAHVARLVSSVSVYKCNLYRTCIPNTTYGINSTFAINFGTKLIFHAKF